jgi:hypothetical protein
LNYGFPYVQNFKILRKWILLGFNHGEIGISLKVHPHPIKESIYTMETLPKHLEEQRWEAGSGQF